ncbi:MAG: hypothetical protein HWQ35_22270 [Nostoc sp. NMS1]|uniref:hypothetical protein n=1 Tax=unclassified Nostoc TaxID=2593658 RepID=UPI0025F03967|nr:MULTISPECIES: hypothetical protein [unclassified Nostoc]MBN3909180.1 hypothetical protein [Nostoc sp. NMS1]MBN3990373.1 hypothetical protein [Nostoc sp. NMS2]
MLIHNFASRVRYAIANTMPVATTEATLVPPYLCSRSSVTRRTLEREQRVADKTCS